MKFDFSLVRSASLVPMFCASAICLAQQPAAAMQVAPAQRPSSLLRPTLDQVAQAGSGVDLNRWKGPNAAREEVDANLASMQKDLQTTLPPLLDAADAAPNSAAASLPVLLNLDALYSVLLRVSIAARTGAPRDQNAALEQAAMLLDTTRRELGDTILANVRAQEQRTADLQVAIQQANTPAAPTPPTAPAVTKPRKRSAK